MKSCLKSLIAREKKIKTIIWYPSTNMRMAKNQPNQKNHQTLPSPGEGDEYREVLIYLLSFSYKGIFTLGSSIPHKIVTQQNACSHKDLYMNVYSSL